MERDHREPGTGILVPILLFTVMVTSIAAAVLYMRADNIQTGTSGLKEEVERLEAAHADCRKNYDELKALVDAGKQKEASALKKYTQQAGEIKTLTGEYESWRNKAENLKRENTELKNLNYTAGREKDKKLTAL